MPNRASILKQQFLQSVALPWKELLPDSTVKELLAKENLRYYNNVYTPIVTLWAMISQVLDPDKSLSQAVKRMSTWLSVAGVVPLNQLLTLLATTGKHQQRQWHQLLLSQVATNLLTIRPERSEPRVLKHRPKPYPRMQEPRSILKGKQALRSRLFQ